MSVRALNWAFEQYVTPAEKVILLAIADMANDEHEAWPSYAYLIRRTGLSERTIRNHIRMLEAMDLLTTQTRVRPNGSQTSNLYVLAVDPPAKSAAPPGKLLPPQEPSLEPDLTRDTESVATQSAGGSTDSVEWSSVMDTIAGQSGLSKVGVISIQSEILARTNRTLRLIETLRVAQWILSKSKRQPSSAHRYVMSSIGLSALEVQQYIDEQGLGS